MLLIGYPTRRNIWSKSQSLYLDGQNGSTNVKDQNREGKSGRRRIGGREVGAAFCRPEQMTADASRLW